MTNDNLPANFDINAVVTQIQTLKQQRSTAMDDVAVLIGQLESKTKAFDKLQQEFNELSTKFASQDAAKTEDKTEDQSNSAS